jgi:hypothetical protein
MAGPSAAARCAVRNFWISSDDAEKLDFEEWWRMGGQMRHKVTVITDGGSGMDEANVVSVPVDSGATV